MAQPGQGGDITRSWTFQTEAAPTVDTQTSGGSITVIAHSRPDVVVELIARRSRRALGPDDELDGVELDVTRDGNRITAVARRASGQRGFLGIGSNNQNLSLAFRIYVPETADIEGRTSGGSISVDGTSGSLEMRTSGGSISIENASGSINMRTSGGSISAANLNGDVALRTSGGSIRLSDLSGSVDARTSGGSIRANMDRITGPVTLRTSGGSITLSLPGQTGINLNLSGTRVNAQLAQFSGTIERNKVVGELMGGGYPVEARTSGGSVTVQFVDQP
ncbi:MAG: DUF4097 family beta strand repeat-containing protein [Balneolaceae bacterium]